MDTAKIRARVVLDSAEAREAFCETVEFAVAGCVIGVRDRPTQPDDAEWGEQETVQEITHDYTDRSRDPLFQLALALSLCRCDYFVADDYGVVVRYEYNQNVSHLDKMIAASKVPVVLLPASDGS